MSITIHGRRWSVLPKHEHVWVDTHSRIGDPDWHFVCWACGVRRTVPGNRRED